MSLLYREEEREMLPLCIDQGVGVIPWSPLARGRLARPWAMIRRASAATSSARPCSRTARTMTATWSKCWASCRRSAPCPARSWRWPGCCAKRGISAPIVGATKPAHIDDALAALELKLSDDEAAALEAPYLPHATVGFE